MEKKTKIVILIIICLLAAALAVNFILAPQSLKNKETVNITDMVGRTVQIPDSVDKVVATSPAVTTLIYMLAPDKLKAMNFEWTDSEKEFVPFQYQNYPNIGGWYGSQDGSYEEFIAIEPDFVIESITYGDSGDLKNLEERQTKMGDIPVVGVYDADRVDNNSEIILFTGKILGEQDKAQKLVDFNEANLDKVKNVTSNISDKKDVYYAEGNNGLQTDGSGSTHGQLIDICGGENVANSVTNQSTQVSIEQVISWNPDIIITTNVEFYNSVYNNSEWASIKAVQNHEVYLSPQSPFKWFDRPCGINMIMGVPWTAKVLYPDEFGDLDLVNQTKYFYSNFYHYDLSDDKAKQILLDSGLNEKNI